MLPQTFCNFKWVTYALLVFISLPVKYGICKNTWQKVDAQIKVIFIFSNVGRSLKGNTTASECQIETDHYFILCSFNNCITEVAEKLCICTPEQNN